MLTVVFSRNGASQRAVLADFALRTLVMLHPLLFVIASIFFFVF